MIGGGGGGAGMGSSGSGAAGMGASGIGAAGIGAAGGSVEKGLLGRLCTWYPRRQQDWRVSHRWCCV